MGLGQNIKTILDAKQRTVPWLAKASGVPASTIYSMIRNSSKSTDDTTLSRLSTALRVPPDVLTSSTIEYPLTSDHIAAYDKYYKMPEYKRALEFATPDTGKGFYLDDVIKIAVYNVALSIPDNEIKKALLYEVEHAETLGNDDFSLALLLSYYYQFNSFGRYAFLQRAKELSLIPDCIAKNDNTDKNQEDK